MFGTIRGMPDNAPLRKEKHPEFQPISPDHAARLEAIARVTGAIAHDFNNILMLINGYADLLLQQTPEDDRRRADIQSIQQAGRRAAALTSQLLTTGRRLPMKMAAIDVNRFLQSQDEALRRELGPDVRLRFDLDEDAGTLSADPQQLAAAFTELARNAREAMPDGGSVTIRTEGVDGAVLVHISDTGCGISADNRERVFEPFFTTKPRGLGRGLGLSVVYGIVTQGGGEIGTHSVPGEGVTITLRFPRA